MKLCKDCKHSIIKQGSSLEYAVCALFVKEEAQCNLVTGETSPAELYHCVIARRNYEFSKMCGKEGSFFEQKG